MSSGIVHLISIGAQDAFLTGSPEISFFQSVYKRHTNFSIFRKNQVILGTPSPGGLSTVRFERLGDLLSYTYLTTIRNGNAELLSNWSDVIDYCELVIGGQVIDKQDVKFTEEIAIDTFAQTYSKTYPASIHSGVGSQSFFYPLRFFFCENWQSVLPLVGLQYHDVELRIRWSQNLNTTGLQVSATSCFISLDSEERLKFTEDRDILVYPVQKTVPTGDKVQHLSFNHPVRFLASSNVSTNSLVSRTNKIKLAVNGVDITEPVISIPNYTAVSSYYHTDYSSSNAEQLFLYPFSLSTSKLQPTGTLNFSRIDSFQIYSDEVITEPIYAVNYNILRISQGMAGLVYAN